MRREREGTLRELVVRFLLDHGLVVLGCSVIFGLIARACHARLRRLRERARLARDVEDALVQNAQGLILKVHGIVKHLEQDDPLRRRVELALDRADEQLSGDRDRVRVLRSQALLDGELLQHDESRASHGDVSATTGAAQQDLRGHWRQKLLRWLRLKRP